MRFCMKVLFQNKDVLLYLSTKKSLLTLLAATAFLTGCQEDTANDTQTSSLALAPKVKTTLPPGLAKKVIVETHSSHFITRMRRRIAEDESNAMDDRINFTFIDDNVFRTLELDDYGTILNYYPKDFIEQPADEMRAIVEAQIRKRNAND